MTKKRVEIKQQMKMITDWTEAEKGKKTKTDN